MDPLVYGDYPFVMKALVRNALPKFSEEEKELVKGAFDFIGVNYYTSRYASTLPIDAGDSPQALISTNTLISKVHAPRQYILKIIMAAFCFICAGTENILGNPGWPLHVTKSNSLV